VLIMYLWATLFSGTVVGLSITKTPLFVLAVATAAAVLAAAADVDAQAPVVGSGPPARTGRRPCQPAAVSRRAAAKARRPGQAWLSGPVCLTNTARCFYRAARR